MKAFFVLLFGAFSFFLFYVAILLMVIENIHFLTWVNDAKLDFPAFCIFFN
jgi:hypothetical protein